jgi:peptidoglycan/LPS O-acetylase OafA/YrhL
MTVSLQKNATQIDAPTFRADGELSQRVFRKGIPSLTGLRGVAAFWVILYHLQFKAGSLWHLPWLDGMPVVERGWAGVDLFFALSGFVLMHVHGREFVQFAQITGAPFVRFAKLRIARVYPLNLVVLFMIAGLVNADPGFADLYRGLAVGNLSADAFVRTALLATRWFLQGSGDWNQPVWSLSAEILGYMAFPLIAVALMACRSFREALAVGLGSLAVLALFQVATRTVGENDLSQCGAATRMICCFLAGTALSRARVLAPNGIARHASALSIGAVVLVLVSVGTDLGAILTPLGFSVLIFALSFEKGMINSVLVSRPVMFLGQISFPLYLLHLMPLIWLQYHVAGRSMPAIAAITVLLGYITGCILAATILNYVIERPSRRLGRLWARGLPGEIAQPGAL